MKLLSSCLALLFAAGCAPTIYDRPGTTEADFDRDRAQCQYEGAIATSNIGTGPTARTYSGAISQGINDGITIGLKRNELFRLCMQARGYRVANR